MYPIINVPKLQITFVSHIYNESKFVSIFPLLHNCKSVRLFSWSLITQIGSEWGLERQESEWKHFYFRKCSWRDPYRFDASWNPWRPVLSLQRFRVFKFVKIDVLGMNGQEEILGPIPAPLQLTIISPVAYLGCIVMELIRQLKFCRIERVSEWIVLMKSRLLRWIINTESIGLMLQTP